ncbi:putative zinc finger/binuclear cluster transcriptional regulator [Desarmillaria tabescens]|uniref:Zinc finger/binuclear cluster transcriptional regulator n=1 Tax=Armillaria tabescens TaxID=1929756 RepID=A0AA39NRD6_ARMTA|nr:putative zinc finger/binuclear cluster transcriptional regulator [Desarmillaria tabescens]KAK0470433.1 putative zinc finger/binuclear cluster transcriptional regulator [Desarmillaria tabescens]
MGGDHKCPVCQATFTRPQHVARHMRSHTGDRPYKCTHCGDQFARSDLLSRHINKCHASASTTTSEKGNGRRKASATRATTSKQACDQCVQSSLPCDGCNPCSKCVQRKCRCTFVKFHRQTAPVGPGHNPLPSTHLPPTAQRSYLPPPVSVSFPTQQQFSFPPPQMYPSNLDDYQSKYRELMHTQTQQPSPEMYHPTPTWVNYEPSHDVLNAGGSGLTRAHSLEHHHHHGSHSNHHSNQIYDEGGGWTRRDSFSESGGSSAASSSVHLPLYENVDPSTAAAAADARLEAFGMMSLEEPNALYNGSAPFFDGIFPSSSTQPTATVNHVPVSSMMQIPTPREAETRALREFWKEYMRSTPLYPPANHAHSASPPHPVMSPPNGRKRVSSLPSVKTPTENIVGGGEGKGGFEDAVMARKTLGNLSMGGIQGIKGRRMTHLNPPSTSSNPQPRQPPINNGPSYGFSLAGAMGEGERPNFKRLPSQVLEPFGGSKRVRGDGGGDDPDDLMGMVKVEGSE